MESPEHDPAHVPAPNPLHELAQALGLAREWRDVEGRDRIVPDAVLTRIAGALGYPAQNEAEIATSRAAIARERATVPAMIVTEVGRPTPLPPGLAQMHLTAHDGAAQTLALAEATIPPIATPGYYQLDFAGHAITLAVAPARCPELDARYWGPALQIASLRAEDGKPYGTLAELAKAVELFAARGAQALAINPLHALFAGEGRDYSPYSPSSRQQLNTAFAAPELLGLPPLDWDPAGDTPLIDWAQALPRQQAELRHLFATLDAPTRARFEAETRDDAELARHALFDALDTHHRAKGRRHWREWPEKHHDPEGKGVRRFAEDHADEIAFHTFTQWLTRAGLAQVKTRARAAGMAIGLVGDLAVGVHTGGADSWTRQGTMLEGLTIGAPPDPLGPLGQNWNLTSFSPQGLKRSGYAPWIALLRSAFAASGALRIDHAFGMARLWVIPEGEGPEMGAYLAYPFEDMLRLAVLEAHRADALLIAENLGTAPFGFLDALEARHLLDMRVLWFERAADDGFIGAADYPVDAVAMTGTHDTATLAGWWTGRDLEWAEALGRLPQGTTPDEAALRRAWDRGLLWACLTHDAAPRPAPEDPAPVVSAALAHIGRTPSVLAIAPLEDLLCEIEQPNLPGTIDEHPNWRRRMEMPLSKALERADVASRLELLDKARKETKSTPPPD